MKKWIAVCLALALCAGLWFWGYYSRKSNDNLPTKESVVLSYLNKGESHAAQQLLGYKHTQLREVWGEPDGSLSGLWGDIWETKNAYNLFVYYDSNGIVEHVKFRYEKEGGFPDLKDVKRYLPEDFTANLADVTREELLEAWGEPSSTNTDYHYDSWQIDEEAVVTIHWDENGKLTNGSISMR